MINLKHFFSFVLLTFTFKNYIVSADISVFLGGSCNPTTWRKDIAIPMLEKYKIAYHNFQIDDWKPELVNLENKAKEKARILLWVIDPLTRNSVSIIEIAAFASTDSDRLVVVMSPFKKRQKILNDIISDEEYYELMNALVMLRYMLDQQNLPIFQNIPSSIDYIAKILKSENASLNKSKEKGIMYVKHGEAQNKQLSVWDSFSAEHAIKNSQVISKDMPASVDKKNLYVGIAGHDVDWFDKSAVPLLKSSSISFYRPITNDFNAQAFPKELQHIKNSKVILLIVSSKVRGMGIMTMGAHLIGLGRKNIILYVQDIPNKGIISGEKLSESAIKDYNRARVYLKDMATRRNVTIFDNLNNALHKAISLAKKM